MDEPTSSLAAPDVVVLMRLVRRLRDRGVAILYISHRLNEILDFCETVTVLKDGSVTADRPLAGLDPNGLVRLMVGRDPRNLFPPYASQSTGALVLETKGFRAAGAADVDFELSRGEILGIGGLVGHGQEDFVMGLYGAIRAEAKEFRVFANGAAVRSAPSQRSPRPTRPASLTSRPTDARKVCFCRTRSTSICSCPCSPAAVWSVAGERRKPQSLNVWRSVSTFGAIDAGRPRRCRAETSRRSPYRNGWRSSPRCCC